MALGGLTAIAGEHKVSAAEKAEHDGSVLAKRTVSIPLNMQERYDYTGRSDGQPVYAGYAGRGVATSEANWIIFKYTYDGSNQMTLKQVAYDSWDVRDTTAEYA